MGEDLMAAGESKPGQWVRIADLGKAGLPAGRLLGLMAMTISELAIAQSLRIAHGDNWAAMYVDRGGQVRFDSEGEPSVWVSD
jgi:hypothetical protein